MVATFNCAVKIGTKYIGPLQILWAGYGSW